MMFEKKVDDSANPTTGAELINKRRKSNFLFLFLLFLFAGVIFTISFTHLQKESNENLIEKFKPD
ncbi:hypothetical protein [Ahrensia sp. 13_GOM-1096m]|uniref:hypothetical protein n=1 Tax=Ahrensia sp. 13_GOM-1096m TaxID=1380380 RepID=UPI00047B1D5C|nr:hypothetical protein [Ahrensia sp. 13_GOM-1096m]